MIKCPFCGTTNVANTTFCSECDISLPKNVRRSTNSLAMDDLGWKGEAESEMTTFSKGKGPLAIHLIIGEQEREIEAILSRVIHLGRRDSASEIFPEIDLTPDNGSKKGVSRRHARIFKQKGSL